MHVITFALSDDLYKILEETFTPAEIDVFINQAVRRQIEESLHKDFTLEEEDLEDDKNRHEWTK